MMQVAPTTIRINTDEWNGLACAKAHADTNTQTEQTGAEMAKSIHMSDCLKGLP